MGIGIKCNGNLCDECRKKEIVKQIYIQSPFGHVHNSFAFPIIAYPIEKVNHYIYITESQNKLSDRITHC